MLDLCYAKKDSADVYVARDKYLVKQVVAEAASLGVTVTENENAFIAGTAILVINIKKLVNGRSVFGVERAGTRSRSEVLWSTTRMPVSRR